LSLPAGAAAEPIGGTQLPPTADAQLGEDLFAPPSSFVDQVMTSRAAKPPAKKAAAKRTAKRTSTREG
jgi:hypothetical protein